MSTGIRAWIVIAVLTACLDGWMIYRRFSGAMGRDVRGMHQAAADRIGGLRVVVAMSVILALVVPLVTLAACAVRYVQDRRIREAELARDRGRGSGEPGEPS
jgi:hypothetical protein